MNKVFLDNLNTIDSIQWTRKGYTAYRNPSPFDVQLFDGKVWRNNYFVARPCEENSFSEVSTLEDAKHVIDEDIAARMVSN